MCPKVDANASYDKLMEKTGFFHNGKPTPGVIEAASLLHESQIDKRIKYGSVIEKLNASAIFELSGSPCIFFARLDQSDPEPSQLISLHSLAWNQGLAPILWVVTPSKVLIFNCYSKPTPDEGDPDRHLVGLFEKTDTGLQQLSAFIGRREIESGQFWLDEKTRKIDRRQRVDAQLLQDLLAAETKLVDAHLKSSVAHALLGRAIFLAYLQDRGILKPQFFRSRYRVESFNDLLTNKAQTYNLFEWIQDTFNGDLFPLTYINGNTIHEKQIVKEEHLKVVQDLLNATDIATGQRRLWPYNFDVIPVELISSIYEMFAHASNSDVAKQHSTHYTPTNLVDLILTQVFDGLPIDAKILDLSCGSGVFLVESFRRLLGRRIGSGEKWSRQIVREILHNQIYGVDISKEAVQIAAFSLYLTALELDPDPQPPSALTFRPLIGSNLFVADAFDERDTFNKKEPFISNGFGAIVGNPPWTRSKASESAVEYCGRHNYPLAKGNPAQAFLWRIGDFTNDGSRVGLVLPSRPFFSHTGEATEAREKLFERFRFQSMTNLSALRHDGLFPTSAAPAMVIIAEGRRPEPGDAVSFVSVEKSEAFKRHGIIEITPDSIKRLQLHRIASDPDLLKVASWGNPRDFALVRKLRDSYLSLKDLIIQNNWSAGIGVKTGNRQSTAPELYDKRFLPAGEMPPFQIDTKTLKPFGKQKLERPRNPQIYKGPLVITPRGLPKTGFYASFTRDDLIYPEVYYGISIPSNQVEMAYYLNGVLNSAVAKYFLFLTSSSWCQ
jgi:type I restriction-modification system DNA methylase subunit